LDFYISTSDPLSARLARQICEYANNLAFEYVKKVISRRMLQILFGVLAKDYVYRVVYLVFSKDGGVGVGERLGGRVEGRNGRRVFLGLILGVGWGWDMEAGEDEGCWVDGGVAR
jgi:hypothetical protein